MPRRVGEHGFIGFFGHVFSAELVLGREGGRKLRGCEVRGEKNWKRERGRVRSREAEEGKE